jgi:zinc transporter ZupT
MEVLQIKFIFIVLTLLFSLLSFLPQNLKSSRFSKMLSALGKNLAAGVFLGIAFLDLLPESFKLLSETSSILSGVIVISSYFGMVFIEKIAFVDHSLVSHGNKHTDLGCHCESNHSDEEESKLKHILSTRTRLYSHLSEGDGEKCEMICKEDKKEPLLPSHTNSSPFSSIVLALVLSIHSNLEGIALGVQSSQIDLIKLGVAVSLHKIPEALVVGITLLQAHNNIKYVLCFIYVLATPIGVAVGIIIAFQLNSIVEGVFLSICAGTFLYIAATEIFVEEFAVARYKYPKFLAAVFGFALVACSTFAE